MNFWEYSWDTCPKAPHRPPEGPNEDISVCGYCGNVSWEMRPEGETFGLHATDCSLHERHIGYCLPDGVGHPRAKEIRGHWPLGLTMESPYREEL